MCVGGSTGSVRGVCARVKGSGYRAVGVITEINPKCTLPLLATLSPDAIIISDDLPESDGTDFTEALHRLCPDIRILLLAKDHEPSAELDTGAEFGSNADDVVQKLLQGRAK